MNLLRSICCLFAGRCAREGPEPKVRGRSEADLGQKEAELEKTQAEMEKVGEVQLSHMEGGKAAKVARQQKAKIRFG
jgi:hypothetical protein